MQAADCPAGAASSDAQWCATLSPAARPARWRRGPAPARSIQDSAFPGAMRPRAQRRIDDQPYDGRQRQHARTIVDLFRWAPLGRAELVRGGELSSHAMPHRAQRASATARSSCRASPWDATNATSPCTPWRGVSSIRSTPWAAGRPGRRRCRRPRSRRGAYPRRDWPGTGRAALRVGGRDQFDGAVARVQKRRLHQLLRDLRCAAGAAAPSRRNRSSGCRR